MSAISAQPELSIVIVNWNSVSFLKPCLASIYKYITGLTFEVIVVDNASYDGSAELIRDEFPNTIFLQSNKNLGFSRANNLGYGSASGNTLLFLNPDTELLDGGIAAMHDYLWSTPRIGAVGCRLVNADLSLQRTYVQAFPTVWNQLVTTDLLLNTFPSARIWSLRVLDDFRGTPMAVDVLAGSCLMVKREVFEHVGMFNESLFMYAEDVDLCYMIQKAGYSINYTGKGTIVHHSGKSSSSTKDTHLSSVLQRESLAIFFEQRRGRYYAWLFKVTTGIAAVFRITVLCCLLPFATRWSSDLYIARAKWTRLLRWALGLERWAVPSR